MKETIREMQSFWRSIYAKKVLAKTGLIKTKKEKKESRFCESCTSILLLGVLAGLELQILSYTRRILFGYRRLNGLCWIPGLHQQYL